MDDARSPRNIKQSKSSLYISLLVIAALVLLYFSVPDFQDFVKEAYRVLTSGDEASISGWVDKLGIWGPLFVIIGMVVQMFLIIVPSPLLMLVSILAYGPVWGTLLSVSAVLIASSIGYLLGRSLGEVSVAKLIGNRTRQKIEDQVKEYGAWAIVITRLLPFLSNDAISFVGGFLQMGYFRFIAATAAGIIPLALLIAYFGENNDQLTTTLLWISGVCLILVIGYYIFRKVKQ